MIKARRTHKPASTCCVPHTQEGKQTPSGGLPPDLPHLYLLQLLEHVVCRHIMSHNILTHLQHGFRSGRSTVTQLLVTTQDIFCQWDNKTQVDIAVLDFAKAFDKVPHQSLLNNHYGIDNNIHTWITSFLTNSIQSVVVDGATSPPTKVISGVPQRTVLGPLLFRLYINDLASVVSSQVRLFADDCLTWLDGYSADLHVGV